MSPLQTQILKYCTKRGVVRARDVVAKGWSRGALGALVQTGALERIGRGLYAVAARPVSANIALAQLAAHCPRAVVCLLSAQQFHGLTTQAPFQVWAAVAPGSRVPKLDYPPLHVIRMSGQSLTSGVEVRRIDGISVNITSIAKTVVDGFKFRNAIGTDTALQALRTAWHTKRVTMDELIDQARVCRVGRVMQPYLESLV